MDLHKRWLNNGSTVTQAERSTLEAEYHLLHQAYSEPQRHYHGLQHLEECFRLFDDVADEADHPGEVQLALWYHDSVYRPRDSDNEQQSAQWAARTLREFGASTESIERVTRMILATSGHQGAATADEQRLLDIDLAILGADPERFQEYERQIRQEYNWVPEATYRERRHAVLTDFLSRPAIYGCPTFRNRFETQARTNICWLLPRLLTT